MSRFSVIYYSNSRLPEALKWFCLRALTKATAASGGELISVTWEPLTYPGMRNIVWERHVATHWNLYEQILAGISEAATQSVSLAEHDVLYPERYHDALLAAADGRVCYNTNVWRLSSRGYFRDGNCRLLSNCGGPRDILARAIEDKLAEIRRCGKVIWAEPDGGVEVSTPFPTIDIRHGGNWTGDREPADGVYSQEIEYWGCSEQYVRLFTCPPIRDH